jgi:hypothetical protein
VLSTPAVDCSPRDAYEIESDEYAGIEYEWLPVSVFGNLFCPSVFNDH